MKAAGLQASLFTARHFSFESRYSFLIKIALQEKLQPKEAKVVWHGASDKDGYWNSLFPHAHIAGHHHTAQLRLMLNMLFIHFLWADFSPVLVEMARMWLSQRNYKQRRGAEPSCFERVMT